MVYTIKFKGQSSDPVQWLDTTQIPLYDEENGLA